MASGLNGILRGVQPDLRGAIMDLAKEGWSPSKTNGGHIRLDHPMATKPVFAPSTPGDFRTTENLRRDCRGALRPLTCLAAPLSEEEAVSSLRAHKRKRKGDKPRPNFIESAGKRVAAGIAKARTQPSREAEPELAAPALPAAEAPMTPEPITTETPDMKMTSQLTAAEGPLTASPQPAPPAPTRKVTRRPRPPSTARRPHEPGAFELGFEVGLRVAAGELMQIRISEDMVGKVLILKPGEHYWVGADPNAIPEFAKKAKGRRNGRFSEAILALLADLKGEEVPVSLIAEHMVERGFYKARSARSGVLRRLEQLSGDGLVTYRAGPGEPVASHLDQG